MEMVRHRLETQNISRAERIASVAAGALLVARGIRRRGWSGAGMALFGAAFLRRGITGSSYSYQALGINTAARHQPQQGAASVAHGAGIRIDESITINRPRAEVYGFWRDLGNVAEFMQHVESVRTTPAGEGTGERSHWVAKGACGRRLEWDAEIINDRKDELIAWRSLEGSEVANAGSIHFQDAAGGRGTEVHVEILYSPPGGAVGALAAKLFGTDPASEVRADLKRLKARLEAGVVPDTAGQPSGAITRPEQTAGGDRSQRASISDQVATASEESFPASDAPAFTH